MLSNSHFTPFSTAQANGLIVVPAFALLSALALAFIVFRSIHLVVIPSFQRNGPACRAPENLFFRTQLGHYAASLVLSNVFLTAAGLMEFFWVKQSGIHQGSMCTFQAVLMQIGYWSTCFFSGAIGVHTCNSLVFRLYQISYLSVVVIAFGWIMSLLIALAPISQAGVYGPVAVSCGIMPAYPSKIYGLEAFPVILVSVLLVIIYSPIFLFLGGILHVKGGVKLTCKVQGRWCAVTDSEEYHRFLAAVAKTMFWYPIAFVSLLLPIAVVNMAQSSGRVIPFGAEVFAHVCCSMLGLVNVGLMYNTFRVLSPVFHCSTLPKIQVDTVKTFGNNASDESPILPAVAHMPKGPLLPLYNDTSKAISPVSLSDFPPVQYHSRNSSTASTDSATHLLSTKRTPSRFHKMRVRQGESLLTLSRAILTPSELNRQLDAASDTESLKGRNLRINLPQMAEVNTPKMAVVTVSLSPAPRSSTASVVTSFPIVPTSIQSTNASPIMRQFTAAFGRPSRKLSMFGSQSKGSGKIPLILTVGPPLSPIPASPADKSPTKKSFSRFRVPSIKRRPTPLDLTDAIPTPVIRPLPVITTKAEALQKVDKGKGRTPPSPTTLVERDVISRSHAALRQLPQLPRNSTASSSSSAHSRPEAATSAAPHERHGSISSLLSIYSISSFLDSLRSTHSMSSVDGGSEKVLPSIPSTRSNTIESMDSESSLSSSFEKHKQSERSTWMTVWSQDSAVTSSQPPDEETMLAYASLVSGASVENFPKREDVSPVPRAPIPFALRPGNSMGIPLSLRT
ncbi:uncharacterized protein F5147DRAFT_108140 [Suillus discolor]|uniref:G-protein coupled receptors family 1 profile domain-containing protein n=1 Tax=Suillus discolor TaxID=1912936 RepID=A0A9P7JVM8_9AGAM|nr:uncharacterized protein F5147DRAFT_108140 [Suillus discolor]KAG2110928.1 hypothetical protein F5147DRAFT_108140 [Suillus discolor]